MLAAAFVLCLSWPTSSVANSPSGKPKSSFGTASSSSMASAPRSKVPLWPRNLMKYTTAKAVSTVRTDFKGYSGTGGGIGSYVQIENALYRTWCSGNWKKTSCIVNAGFDALPSGAAGSYCDSVRYPDLSDDVWGCWQRWLWQRTVTVKRIERRKVWISFSGYKNALFTIPDSPSYQVPPPLLEYYGGKPKAL